MMRATQNGTQELSEHFKIMCPDTILLEAETHGLLLQKEKDPAAPQPAPLLSWPIVLLVTNSIVGDFPLLLLYLVIRRVKKKKS